MALFDPHVLSEVITDILSREKGCQYVYTLTRQNPEEPSPVQAEKETCAAAGKPA